MAVLSATLDVVEDLVGDQTMINERDRVVGEQRPEVLGELELGGRTGSKPERRQDVRTKDHQGDDAYLRIRGSPATSTQAAEGGFVLFGVGDTERRSVESMDDQATPAVFVGGSRGPVVGGVAEEDGQWFGPQSVTGLHHGAARYPSKTSGPLRIRQDEVEVPCDGLNGAISKQPHANHDPYGMFGRQLAPPYGGRSRGFQGAPDVIQIERSGQNIETGLRCDRGRKQCLSEVHSFTRSRSSALAPWPSCRRCSRPTSLP